MTEIIQEKPKINEETYNELMEKSRAEFPMASEWILHVAVTDHLMVFLKTLFLLHNMLSNFFV